VLVRLERGGRFFGTFVGAAREEEAVVDAWRLAKDDVVEEENDERRFCVVILNSHFPASCCEQDSRRRQERERYCLLCFKLRMLLCFRETLAAKRERERERESVCANVSEINRV